MLENKERAEKQLLTLLTPVVLPPLNFILWLQYFAKSLPQHTIVIEKTRKSFIQNEQFPGNLSFRMNTFTRNLSFRMNRFLTKCPLDSSRNAFPAHSLLKLYSRLHLRFLSYTSHSDNSTPDSTQATHGYSL